MTWEIAVGLFTIVSAFCGVMSVVVKVNKTLTTLDISVNRLNESMKEQSAKNDRIFDRLEQCDRRLVALERGGHYSPHRRTSVAVWPEVVSPREEVNRYEED